MDKQIVDKIIDLLYSYPLEWSLDECRAKFGRFDMWIANAPYADCSVKGNRIGNYFSRKKIRKALKFAKNYQIMKELSRAEHDLRI